MKMRLLLTLAGLAIGFALPTFAQEKGVLGTWTLVTETAYQGGKRTEPLGPNPLGSVMFDRGGHFMLMIARPGLPAFAANKRDAGTPEENKAVLEGSLAFFGTYSVSEADQVLTLHVEVSTFPQLELDRPKALYHAHRR